MPLVKIKSDLARIQFGLDRPFGGSSNQPYIKFVPPPQFASDLSLNSRYFSTKYAEAGTSYPTPTPFIEFYNANSNSLDYPVRGGGIELGRAGLLTTTSEFALGVSELLSTPSSRIDRLRISKFFKDAPRGTAFIQKQIGLQLSNPKIETEQSLFGFGKDFPVPSQLENTRIYNGGKNTLTQIAVSGTGAHANRHGVTAFNVAEKNYYATVNKQNVFGDYQGSNQNRLVLLSRLKMVSTSNFAFDSVALGDINLINSLGISLNKNYLFQYLGGPGSTYGIGTTTIPRRVDTTTLGSANAMVYSQLKQQKSNEQVVNGKTGYKIQDFRTSTGAGDLRKMNYVPWGNNQVDNRFYVSSGKYIDKLNKSKMFVFRNDVDPWEYNKADTDDLIKFVFEAISNDNPSDSLAIFFRAFLTAGINDNNSATLNSFKYMGRGENFYTYQGFDRSIGFSFRLAAGSKDELLPMYNRLNALISQVYPDYSENGIMRAPVVRVTIGDYLYRMPGFLESVNVTVDNGSPWEVNLENNPNLAQLPQVVDVSVAFKPIFDFLPKRVKYNAASMLPPNDSITNSQGTINQSVNENYVSKITGAVPLIANANYIKNEEIKAGRTRQATTPELQQRQEVIDEQNKRFQDIYNSMFGTP